MEVTSAFRASSVPLSCPVARIRQAASASGCGKSNIELTRSTTDWDEADQSNKTIQRHGATVWSVLRSFRAGKRLRLVRCDTDRGAVHPIVCAGFAVAYTDIDRRSSSWSAADTTSS
jgi:hypothetical protein